MLLKTSYKMKPPPSVRLNTGHPLVDKLVAYWPMGEGSGVKAFDISRWGNTGTLTGGAAWATGKFGRAVELDGTDGYISLKDYVAYTTGVSMSGWFKLSAAPSDRSFIVSMRQQLLEINSAGNIRVWPNIVSPLTYTWTLDTSWHHVVGTVKKTSTDTTNLKLYLDGALVAEGNKGAFDLTAAYKDLGRYGSDYFKGRIGDVMLWSRVLTLSDVVKLFVDSFCMFERRQRALVSVP